MVCRRQGPKVVTRVVGQGDGKDWQVNCLVGGVSHRPFEAVAHHINPPLEAFKHFEGV